jgi:imidazolonepropionase-like amidohydrolase
MHSLSNIGLLIILLYIPSFLNAQTVAIKGQKLFDGNKESANPTIIIYKDRIVEINFTGRVPDSATVIDLAGYTLLPGLIDAHTHVLHDGGDYEKDLYNNSDSYRSIRATSFLKLSLLNGFTCLRDLCTEGAGYSDVDLSKAIEAGFIDGPRLIPATKGIAATGRYLPRASRQNWNETFPSGTQFVSGKDECLKAVREQISHGAKWIKVFVDFPVYNAVPSFTDEELIAIVTEAKKFNVPVAAHATSSKGIEQAIRAGVRSIEHGAGAEDDSPAFHESLVDKAIANKVYWCPTLLGMHAHEWQNLDVTYRALARAHQKGLKIVLGTDSGSGPWTVNQAKEIELYVQLVKMKPIDAIKTATLNAAELLGRENELGQIKAGFFADIIAVKGDPLVEISLLQKIDFVMKNGKIYKRP